MAAPQVVAQLRVEDADSAAADPLRVRMRFKQRAPSAAPSDAKKKPRALALQVDLIKGQALWSCELTEEHKPMVLDCSGAEYLRGLEAVITHGNSAAQHSRGAPRAFLYRWSRKSGVLTLMETSDTGFAMKYTSIKFAPTDDRDAHWSAFLQEIADMQAHAAREIAQQRELIHELELLLKAKDNTLETALEAKQRVEDQLFEGFSAVLNAKKDEPSHELTVAQVHANDAESLVSAKSASKRKQQSKKPMAPAKANGAKLKQGATAKDDEVGDYGDDNSASNSGGDAVAEDGEESDRHDDSDEESGGEDAPRARRSQAKREAVDACSQLPSTIRSSSQVSSADDVLSNLDAIMKQEVDANEDAM